MTVQPKKPPTLADIMHKLNDIKSEVEKAEKKAESRDRIAPWTGLAGLGLGIVVAGLIAGYQANPEGIRWFPIEWWFVLFMAGLALMIVGGLATTIIVKKEKIS